MERRHFLKLAFGIAAGAAVLAASAQAAPLAPQPLAQDERLPPAIKDAHPALTTEEEVNRLKPEEVRWGHHGHGHHWGWQCGADRTGDLLRWHNQSWHLASQQWQCNA